ncbi:unnamed protein product [Chironomus riparius]|uniref:Uncharacterized protein n=1 Tax=Chironomus riparius TaxID=315576 RepID=A0A9N9RK72_9DIPT|nr:unnamed protein product [Chironomus riparius]
MKFYSGIFEAFLLLLLINPSYQRKVNRNSDLFLDYFETTTIAEPFDHDLSSKETLNNKFQNIEDNLHKLQMSSSAFFRDLQYSIKSLLSSKIDNLKSDTLNLNQICHKNLNETLLASKRIEGSLSEAITLLNLYKDQSTIIVANSTENVLKNIENSKSELKMTIIKSVKELSIDFNEKMTHFEKNLYDSIASTFMNDLANRNHTNPEQNKKSQNLRNFVCIALSVITGLANILFCLYLLIKFV